MRILLKRWGSLCFLFLIIPVLGWWMLTLQATWQAKRTKTQLVAKGESLKFADYAPTSRHPEKDGTALLQKAFAELGAPTKLKGGPPDGARNQVRQTDSRCSAWRALIQAQREASDGGALREAEPELRRIVTDWARALQIAAEALERPYFRFYTQYEDPWSCTFMSRETWHHAGFERLICAFEVRAYLRAVDGDRAGAIRDCERAVRLAHALSAEPAVVDQQLRFRIGRRAVFLTEAVLSTVSPSVEELYTLSQAFAMEGTEVNLHRVLAAERARDFELFDELMTEASSGPEGFSWQQLMYLLYRPSIIEQQRRHLEPMTYLVRAAARPYPEARDALAEFDPPLNAAWPILIEVTGLRLYRYLFDDFPLYEARMRTASVGCHLAAELQRGGPPEQAFFELPEELKKDPFSDGPLKLLVGDRTLTVYSVGFNMKDDHAETTLPLVPPRPMELREMPDDVVFVAPRPLKRVYQQLIPGERQSHEGIAARG